MTCWLCHGGANPTGGAIVLGPARARSFDYGLLLATAAVLDDANAAAAAYRRARGFPPGRTVRARLLLAGPGRQDLTGEFGLDVTVPGYHSARYAGTARVRQGTRGLVNPISVPAILAAPGLALENWSGSEAAAAPWLERLLALGGAAPAPTAPATRRRSRAPSGARCSSTCATWARWACSRIRFPGCSGPTRSTGTTTLSPTALARDPDDVRRHVGARRARRAAFARPRRADARGDRARARDLQRARRRRDRQPPDPEARAARLRGGQARGADPGADRSDQAARGEAGGPLRRLSRRRAAGEPGCRSPRTRRRSAAARIATWRTAASTSGRRSARHRSTPRSCPSRRCRSAVGPPTRSRSARGATASTATSGRSSTRRAACSRSTPTATATRSGNPAADRRAGGIGTDPWLAFDVPRAEWPFAHRRRRRSPTRRAPVTSVRRASAPPGCAPRRSSACAASAPYLHNGSVPSLRALLDPPRERPVTLPARQGRLRLRHAPARQRQPGPRLRHRAHGRRESRPGRLSRIAVAR